MENTIGGIIVILLVGIGYYYSWRYHQSENYTLAIALVMLCGALLLLFTAADFYLHPWDERYHALVAKNLIHQPFTPTLYRSPLLPYDFREWTGNHVWVHKQPLPLWTMAFSLWLFGEHEIALRLPSLLLTTLGVGLVFQIGHYFFDRATGYVAALLFSLNGLIIELSAGRVATDHVDVFFLFFIVLSIYLSIRLVQTQKFRFAVLVGVSMAAAILCKWLPALIVLPVWFLLALDSKRYTLKKLIYHGLSMLVVAFVLVFPWQWYIHESFPAEAAWEATFNLRHFTEVLDRQGGPAYYFIDRIRINYGDLLYVPLVWWLWTILQHPRTLKSWALAAWGFIPLLFFSLAQTKMQGYIVFTAPVWFMITAAFFFRLRSYRKTQKVQWPYTLLMILLIALPVRYTLERVKPFSHRTRHPEWVQALKNLDERSIGQGILLNYPYPIEAMFYTDLTVYDRLPEKMVIEQWINEGYTVLIEKDGSSLENFLPEQGVRLVDLVEDVDPSR